jgi:hypothetical protein
MADLCKEWTEMGVVFTIVAAWSCIVADGTRDRDRKVLLYHRWYMLTLIYHDRKHSPVN